MITKEFPMKNNTLLEKGELIIYTARYGNILTEARLENETIWMTEQQIALIFERDRTVIGRHIKNIIKTGELEEKSNVQKMHIANSDKPVVFYNLSFGGIELYTTLEHKAAMLLYLVKNHSFVDGNKRIAAALLLYFLEKNRILYHPDSGRCIGDDGLAALTLLIAISKPAEKDTMIRIVLAILNRKTGK
jgi:prophage maintenance system killer protein